MFVVCFVLGGHALGLWALQAALPKRAAPVQPVQAFAPPVVVVATRREAPAALAASTLSAVSAAPSAVPLRPLPPRDKPTGPKVLQVHAAKAAPLFEPEVAATAPPEPVTSSLAAVGDAKPSTPLPGAFDSASAAGTTAAAQMLELPSSQASFLNNPKPPYPARSKQLGEQGRVVLNVFVDANGAASGVSVSQSSAYPQLDRAAVNAVRLWRFVPGKRNGVPEGMSHQVPVTFRLEGG